MTTPEPVVLDPTVETWALEYPGRLSEYALEHIYHQLEAALPGKRVVVVQEGGRFRSLASLDAAWAEAEAALPDGWQMWSLDRNTVNGEWRALAGATADSDDPIVGMRTHADPAAALRDLAAALRERVS